MKYNFHQLLDCSKYVQALYEELLKDVKGVHMHKQPADPRYDANFWLCAGEYFGNTKAYGAVTEA